jgi:hypothetical protein
MSLAQLTHPIHAALDIPLSGKPGKRVKAPKSQRIFFKKNKKIFILGIFAH